MLKPDWNPSSRVLRQFAWLTLAFCIGVGLWRAWRGHAFDTAPGLHGAWLVPMLLWIVGVIVAVLGVIDARLVRPVYVTLTAATFPIGWVVSHLLLGLVYFGLFTLIGAVFRLIGRDPLHRRIDRQATTYWRNRPAAPDASRYFRLS